MKAAYISSEFDHSNPKVHHSIGYFLTESLKKELDDLQVLPAADRPSRILSKASVVLSKLFTGRKQIPVYQPAILKALAAKNLGKLKETDTDLIFTFGAINIAYLDDPRPKVFFTDATFPAVHEFYEYYSNLNKRTIFNAYQTDRDAFRRAARIIFSSQWAAQSAIDNYDVDQSKIRVVQVGANFENTPQEPEIIKSVENRSRDELNLVFSGGDWKRKQGKKAVEVTKILNNKGIKTILNIIGNAPEISSSHREFIKPHGYIQKFTDEGYAKFKEVHLNSHFLLLLTRADCTPHAIPEANAFALPAITTNVGGIPEMIKDNISGKIFYPEESAGNIADYIAGIFKSGDNYSKMAFNAYSEYKSKLNWQTAAKSFKKIFEEII